MEPKKCPKCGREAAENMAFCTECLAEMKKYPVKPGVVVLLPQRDKEPKPAGRRRHNPPSPEKQIEKLRKRIRALALALVLALGAAGLLGWMAATDFLDKTDVKLPGQNYSSQTPSFSEETP